MLFRARQSKCLVASYYRITRLFQKSSWIKITANRLSYALGFKKKSLENWNIIKNWHSEHYTSDTSKPGNFNGLRGNLKLPPKLLKFPALLVLTRRVSTKIKCCSYFSHPLDDRHGASPEALGPAGIVVKTRAKNCSKVL